MRKYPQALAWVDIQTANLADKNDFSEVDILEIAIIFTDFNLGKLGGYHEAVKLTRPVALKALSNDTVKEMHTKNGLLQDAKASEFTLEQIESTIIQVMKDKTSFEQGEFLLAGSEVGTFELPLIREKMPNLSSWLQHYPFDIGNASRVMRILNRGEPIVNTTRSKTKTYRALDNVNADLLEAQAYVEGFKVLGL